MFLFTTGHLDYPVIFSQFPVLPLPQLFEYTKGLNTNQSPWQHATVTYSFKYDNEKNCPKNMLPPVVSLSKCILAKFEERAQQVAGANGGLGLRAIKALGGGVASALELLSKGCFFKTSFKQIVQLCC